jgi:glycosyltransferase involved in cell wall biosynthesis
MAVKRYNMKKLVSIVIPTWNRTELLAETLWHIAEQSYHYKEVIVVSDGQDKRLYDIVDKYDNCTDFQEINLIELGRNWSGLDKSSFGIAPLLVGYLAARGEYVMPWCDDERAVVSDHIEKMVNEIEEKDVDFVYPRVYIWRNGNRYGPESNVIGTVPPRHGEITHYLFRPENFIKFGFPDWKSHPVDWSLIEKWLKNGATYSMINEVTFEHRLDQ